MDLQNTVTYVKAVTLRDFKDVDSIISDVNKGTILIIRITPLAQKSIDELRDAVDKLYNFVQSIDGDIARLGEERVVITPTTIKIWKDGNKLQ